MLIGLIMATSFRQPRDQLDKLGDQIEGVMKCAVNVADHMQEEGKYGEHVSEIERYLLEFARLSEDVNLRKEALTRVQQQQQQQSGSENNEEPLDLSNVFKTCLKELQGQKKASYDPQAHPIVQDLLERLHNSEGESDEEGTVERGGLEESDLVVGQVDKSLKCPLTKAYLEEPVYSKVCKHSYSREAIIAHIRNSRKPSKCPVCGKSIAEEDLVKDRKLEKAVRKAKRKRSSLNQTAEGVVKL